MTYKTIFIDWYITLSHSHYWEHLRTTDPESFTLFSGWLTSNMDEFSVWMRGHHTTSRIAEMIAIETNRPAKFVQSELEISCYDLKVDIPDIIHELQRLRASGCRVVLATDNIIDFSNITIDSQNLRNVFDDILNSAELGVLKSDVGGGFFDSYLSANNQTATECMLIDDSLAVSEGIEGTGLEQRRVRDSAETLALLRTL